MKLLIKQAISILKIKDSSKEELKRAYKEQARLNHPDKGGDLELMKLVNLAYETLNNAIYKVSGIDSRSKSILESFKSRIDKIINYTNIKIEVCGTWLWVSGETYSIKNELKQLNFRWAFKKKAWYYHENKISKKYKRRTYSMNRIRNTFGSEEIKRKDQDLL